MTRQQRSRSVARVTGAALLFAVVASAAPPAAAHHSLAMYDLEQSIHFDGVIEAFTLRNPHSELTLTVSTDDGRKHTVAFVEAPGAARLGHMGLTAAQLAPGQAIKATGAPRRDAPNLYYLTALTLASGRRYTFAD